MELKDIWANKDWDHSEFDFADSSLLQIMRRESASQLQLLIQLLKREMYKSLFFALAFPLIYIVKPNWEFGFALALISVFFIVLALYLWYRLVHFNMPDPARDTVYAIRHTLTFVRQIGATQRVFIQAFLPLSVAGGFLIGILLAGRSFQMLYEHPALLVFIGLLLISSWFWGPVLLRRFAGNRFKPLIQSLEEKLAYLESETFV